MRSEVEDGRALLEDLCAAIGAACDITLVPTVASTYRELANGLASGRLGIAWLPPVTTLDVVGRRAGSVLAIPSRRGVTSYYSALIVRRGGPRTLDDLRGRRAAWVQRESAAGYLVPRLHLASCGFDVLRFFARELFVHSHPAVVDAIVSGEADVGATYCNVDPQTRCVVRSAWQDEAGAVIRPIEALATVGPIPNDALVASSALPAGARSTLARWLFALERDPSATGGRARAAFDRLLGASDFRVPSDEHYKALEHTLRVAHARGQDGLPPSSRMRMRAMK